MEKEKNTKHFSFGFGTGVISGLSDFAGRTVARANTKKITVDSSSMNMKFGTAFKGFGCISAGGSSRLLMDYKILHPEIYDEILSLLFKEGYGAELSHIKVEIGSDVNSLVCTESSLMRSENENADVMKSAGFIFASDALKINPNLEIDMIRYGEAGYIKNAFAESKSKGYRLRYKWYLRVIEDAFKKLNIKFTHISPDKSGTEVPDIEWLIYFSKRLRCEKNKLYDYSKIKIVASDGTTAISEKMLKNEKLRKSVDIIGLHNLTLKDENAEKLINNCNKEVWNTEISAPSNVPKLSVNCDASGIAGENSITDIAIDIIKGFANCKMTMYEFLPAVSGYYSGNNLGQLITAGSPWSGHYSVNSGFFMTMHFTRFIGRGWRFIESACDGINDSYVTFMPEDKSEITMIFCNDTSKPKGYMVDISTCDFENRTFKFVETKGAFPASHYAQNWFRNINVKKASRGKIYIESKPYSIITITTLNTAFVKGVNTIKIPSVKRQRLRLPYNDSFCYPEKFIAKRGIFPLLTCDEGGVFEISGDFLQQKIKKDIIPENSNYRETPNPVTFIGDESWVNYSAEVEFILETPDKDNYAGIGVHCDSSYCGCSLRIYGDGRAEIYFMDNIVSSFSNLVIKKNCWNKIKILALANIYMIYFNDKFIGDFEEKNIIQPCGRISIFSGFYENKFRRLRVNPVSGTVEYANRIDALSSRIIYSKNVMKNAEASYKYTNHTSVTLKKYSIFEFEYSGYGFALCGTVEKAELDIVFDGRRISSDYIEVGGTEYHQAFYRMKNVEKGKHKVHITVIDGEIILDSLLAFAV
ncbi:MAG: hypothetical protein K2G63_07390 [Oscillospiraceae bacterium]|nr:hypothetical protein [Oscillospiraceae bacterium]